MAQKKITEAERDAALAFHPLLQEAIANGKWEYPVNRWMEEYEMHVLRYQKKTLFAEPQT